MIENFSTPLLIITTLAAATLVGVWISLIIWTVKDIRSRTKDKLSIALAIISVTILPFTGFLIYLILRPKYSIEQKYQTVLEEEALLESIEHKNRCTHCGNVIQKEWQFCPFCQSELKIKCENCSYLLDPSWSLCPICGSSPSVSKQDDQKSDRSITPSEQVISEEIIEEIEDSQQIETETLIEENDFDTL